MSLVSPCTRCIVICGFCFNRPLIWRIDVYERRFSFNAAHRQRRNGDLRIHNSFNWRLHDVYTSPSLISSSSSSCSSSSMSCSKQTPMNWAKFSLSQTYRDDNRTWGVSLLDFTASFYCRLDWTTVTLFVSLCLAIMGALCTRRTHEDVPANYHSM